MVDPGLVAICKRAVQAKKRNYVTISDVVAVALQESAGVPTFTPWDPDYKVNMRAAQRITGMGEADIRKLIIIPAKLNLSKPSYAVTVPNIMVNKFAKFRLEPSYWEKYPHLENADRFYKSCSWGLGQLMGEHLANTDAIKIFITDIPAQALQIADMMDDLLIHTEGDLYRAYAGYNSGNTESVAPSVVTRAARVWAVSQAVSQELEQCP